MEHNNWGEMPRDVATKIAEHIESYEDLEAFGWVCSSWRWAAKDATFRASLPSLHHHHNDQVPWLMLPERHYTPRHRRVYSLSKRMVRHVNIPRHGYVRRKKINPKYLSLHGWLFSFSFENHKVFLINPFWGAVVKLPQVPLLDHINNHYEKFVLSANPTTTSDYTIAVILSNPYANLHCWDAMVAIWRSGDNHWVKLEDHTDGDLLGYFAHDIGYYRGEFYAIDEYGFVTALGSEGMGPYRQVAELHLVRELLEKHHLSRLYLVESSGRLLVVLRWMKVDCHLENKEYTYNGKTVSYESASGEDPDYITLYFRAFEVNVESGEVKEVKSLGNRAIFLGLNSSFSLEASPAHGCMPNCIYFTDDYDRLHYEEYKNLGRDIGVYNFGDGKIEGCYDGPSRFDGVTPPMWVEPPQ